MDQIEHFKKTFGTKLIIFRTTKLNWILILNVWKKNIIILSYIIKSILANMFNSQVIIIINKQKIKGNSSYKEK